MRAWLKSQLPRDLRAFIALMASVGGTAVLTAVACWMVWILWRGGWPINTASQRIDKLGTIAVLVVLIMGLTMTGLGLAINRRQMKGKLLGNEFEASGGDDDTKAATLAEAGDALSDKAAQIKGSA